MSGSRHHFVITLQWSHGNGYAMQSQHGTVNVQPDTTRTEVLQYLLERMQEGKHGTPNILFFSLEPDGFQGGAL